MPRSLSEEHTELARQAREKLRVECQNRAGDWAVVLRPGHTCACLAFNVDGLRSRDLLPSRFQYVESYLSPERALRYYQYNWKQLAPLLVDQNGHEWVMRFSTKRRKWFFDARLGSKRRWLVVQVKRGLAG